jgi:hypothetical protein
MSDLPADPRITFAAFKLENLLDQQKEQPDPDFVDITTHKDQVLERYQRIFNLDHIPNLTRDEFESFLYYENNHHWTDYHRVKKFMTSDMSLLRRALQLLLDETRLVHDRINRIRPGRHSAKDSMVSHLGIPVLTAILLVVYPEKYGVWNKTSEDGMEIVGLWDDRWDGDLAGDVYVEMNQIYHELCRYLKIDLWTLDALWWVLKK